MNNQIYIEERIEEIYSESYYKLKSSIGHGSTQESEGETLSILEKKKISCNQDE